MTPWARNIVMQNFLDTYQKHPNLYQSSHPRYKNKIYRDRSYDEIIRDLNLDSKVTHDDIRLKIKSVRTMYAKQLNLMSKDPGYVPQLAWFKQASTFLGTVSTYRKSAIATNNKILSKMELSSNFESIEHIKVHPDVNYEDSAQDFDQDSPEPRCENPDIFTEDSFHEEKKFDLSIQQKSIALENELRNHYKNDSNKLDDCFHNDDEYQLFANSVAAQLKAIPDPYSRAMAKFKIQLILFQAETGKFKDTSFDT